MSINPATSAGTRRSASDALAGRVLTVTGASDARAYPPMVDRALGGLVLTSQSRQEDARLLRRLHPDLVLVVEPRYAMTEVATPDAPFVLPEPDGLFQVPVEEVLTGQRNAGADIAMTPSGFVLAGEPDTLRALVAAGNAIDRNDVLLHVFLAPTYLTPANLRQTTAILRKSRHPIALTLASEQDPMTGKGIIDGMRHLCTQLPWVMLWRADLAGFDALAHGAKAAAIGTMTSTRHGVPAGKKGFAILKDKTPSVFVPYLGRFIRSSVLQDWYAATNAPTCPCSVCHGRGIDWFTQNPTDVEAARLHSLLLVNELHARLRGASSLAAEWARYAADAVAEHEVLRALTSINVKTPSTLVRWAERQTAPSTTANTVSANNHEAGV